MKAKLFLRLLAAVGFLIVSSATVALADEGVLVLPNGQVKYFKDGEFVSYAVEGPDGTWKRADTGQSIGKFFQGPEGVKGSDGVWRSPPTKPTPRAQSLVR